MIKTPKHTMSSTWNISVSFADSSTRRLGGTSSSERTLAVGQLRRVAVAMEVVVGEACPMYIVGEGELGKSRNCRISFEAGGKRRDVQEESSG